MTSSPPFAVHGPTDTAAAADPPAGTAVGTVRRERLLDGGHVLSLLRRGGLESRPRILYVHGSPNDATYWMAYLDRPVAGLEPVAVDRPGFGGSRRSGAVPDIAEQARRLAPLLEVRDGVGTIVVGQSQGGPIALQLAADFPDAVAGLVIAAGAVAPAYNGVAWFNRLAHHPPVRWFLGDAVRISNDEMLDLPRGLHELEGRLDELTLPVEILQGRRDWMVDPRNADWLENELSNGNVNLTWLPTAGHKIPKTHPHALRAAICRLRDAVLPEDEPAEASDRALQNA